MIITEGEYYLYRHIRFDKNEVFYVGIGTKQNSKTNKHSILYKRAYSKSKRGQYWDNITYKSNYRIEIIIESDNREFIEQKEKEFIKLYGRKDLGLGTLVNLTDGGDGAKNAIRTEKEKINLSLKLTKPYYMYDLNGNFIQEWKSFLLMNTKLNFTILDDNLIRGILNKTKGTNIYKGFCWSRIKNNKIIPIQKIVGKNKKRKNFIKLTNMLTLKEEIFKTTKDISKNYPFLKRNTIHKSLQYNRPVFNNYKFEHIIL